MSAVSSSNNTKTKTAHDCEGGVLYGILPPQSLNETAAERYRFIVILENHACVQINWQDRRNGNRDSVVIRGQRVIFMPAQTSYGIILKQNTRLIRLCLPDDIANWKQFIQMPSLKKVEHYSLWELVRHDVGVVDIVRIFNENIELENPIFPKSYFRHLGAMLAFHLIGAWKREKERKAAPATMDADRLSRVFNYIEDNLSGKISIKALANVACLSLTHFKRLFKASTGMSGRAYIAKERIRRAQSLLCQGGMRVAEVAALSGFCDQSHLDRAFRRFCQCTPKEFLRDGPLVPKNGPGIQSKQK